MDFAYMKRPVLYYQFDKERFRNEHLSKSYFDFEDDGFGPVCTDLDVLLNELCNVLEDGCIMNEYYVGRHNRFFHYMMTKIACVHILHKRTSIQDIEG